MTGHQPIAALRRLDAEPPLCLHCDVPARLTSGREVYPRRRDLWGRPIWRCECGAYCGCHPGGNVAVGRPADKPTRMARMHLHNQRLDPIWRTAPKRDRQRVRRALYGFLARELGLERGETHTGLWDVETCRRAWVVLAGITANDVLMIAEDEA